MDNSKNTWFAVYTKPSWEMKVSKLLHQKKIEHYVPLRKELKQWSDRKKIVNIPLFSGYVFVKINETEFIEVLKTSGVVNFVFWLKSPARIRNEEIEVIKKFVHEYQFIACEKDTVNVKDSVRILTGPLMHREGNVLEIKHRSIKVNLPSLGYNLVATVDKSQIELLSQTSVPQVNVG